MHLILIVMGAFGQGKTLLHSACIAALFAFCFIVQPVWANITPVVTSVAVEYGDVPRVDRYYECVYTATDADIVDPCDGDCEVLTPFYGWWSNGFSLQRNTDRYLVLSTNNWRKGDTITCDVQVRDTGLLESNTLTAETITIVNTPPQTTNPTVTPNPVTTVDDLTCNLGVTTDIDDDSSVFSYAFAWLLNDTYVAGQTTNKLDSSLFTRGDGIQCQVVPSDLEDAGDAAVSTLVYVQNSPPVVESVLLTPTTAYTTNDLLCTVGDVSDADNDTATDFAFSWYINGEVLLVTVPVDNTTSEVEYTNSILTANYTQVGDSVECLISAYDGFDWGETSSSDPKMIQNTPPVVTSVEITPNTPDSFSNLTCTVLDVFDVDATGNDTYTYYFIWVVNNITIQRTNSSTTNMDLFDQNHFVKNDVVSCYAAANDTTLGAYTKAENVSIANSPPIITGTDVILDDPVAPLSLTCDPGTVVDPDEDTSLTYFYKWFTEAGGQISGKTSNAIFAVSSDWAEGDTVYCSVAISDGTDTSDEVFSVRKFMYAPIVRYFNVSDEDRLDNIYDNGDELYIEFDLDTDRGALYYATFNLNVTEIGETLDKAQVDELFIFATAIGTDYSGMWLTSNSFVITIIDARGHSVELDVSTVAARHGVIGTADGNSLLSSGLDYSPALTGDFGRTGAIYGCGFLGETNSYTTSTIKHVLVKKELQQWQREWPSSISFGAGGGGLHAFVGSPEGLLWGFGSNEYGQLGLTTDATDTLTANQATYAAHRVATRWEHVSSLDGINITGVAAGEGHSLALDSDGRVYGSGSNQYGQLNLGTSWIVTEFTALPNKTSTGADMPPIDLVVAAGEFSLYLCQRCAGPFMNESQLYAFGHYFGSNYTQDGIILVPSLVSGLEGMHIKQVVGGQYHVLILTENHGLWSWGRNYEGQLGISADVDVLMFPQQIANTTTMNITSIAAGNYHSVAVDMRGNVYCWGKNGDGECGSVGSSRIYTPSLIDSAGFDYTVIRKVVAGPVHTIAINFIGEMYAMGNNLDSVLGVTSSLVNQPVTEPTLLKIVGGSVGPWIEFVLTTQEFSIAIPIAVTSPCFLGCSGHGFCDEDTGTCTCIGDWEGNGCSEPICEVVDGELCSGLGDCVAGLFPYCDCPSGYTGLGCEEPDCDIDTLNNCNAGAVIEVNSNYSATMTHNCILVEEDFFSFVGNTSYFVNDVSPSCNCTVGWAQPDCSECDLGFEGNICETLTCEHLNNCTGVGQCVYNAEDGEVQCDCSDGFTSDDCSLVAPDCVGTPDCSGHGTCTYEYNDTPINGSFIDLTQWCVCDDRWSGEACDTYRCLGDIFACSNHGDCVLTNSSLLGVEIGVCECYGDFAGSDCSQPLCTSNNGCGTHGDCVVENGAGVCSCADGWDGNDCATDVTVSEAEIITYIVIFVIIVVLILACMLAAFVYRKATKITSSTRYFDPVIRPRKRDFLTIHTQ